MIRKIAAGGSGRITSWYKADVRCHAEARLAPGPTRRLALTLAAGLAVAAWTVGASAAPILKGPYLQALGPRAVTVKLETAAADTPTVEVTDAAGVSRAVSAADARTFHALRVDGLEPATAYTYRVRTEGGESPKGTFTTTPADDRPFRFLVYGDTRSDPAAHAAVVRAMKGAPGDFLIQTGDMVATGSNRSEWQSFFDIEADLLRDRCAFAAVGNHELTGADPSGEIAFLRYFAGGTEDGREESALHGSMRWANARFFFLNAMDSWTGAERDWLKDALTKAEGEAGLVHRIAVLHHGPFSSGPHGGNQRLATNHIVDMMRDHGVDLVLAGHDHVYERGEGRGLKYVISGGGGAPLYEKERAAAESLAFESVHHFVEVSVSGAHVDIVARRASGSVIEACGYDDAGPWKCGAAPPTTKPATSSLAPSSAAAGACGCDVPGPLSGGDGALALALALGLAASRARSPRSRVP